MKIITLDREFGSGGRELGKRLSDALKIPCYDSEIIEAVAKLKGLDPWSVSTISQMDIETVYSGTIARRFIAPPVLTQETIEALVAQEQLIRSLASHGDCIMVGRCADVVLEDMHPMNLFVYASRQAKLRRCVAHIRAGETQKGILRQMKRIDCERASYRQLLSDTCWGETEAYHLCINTTGCQIKSLVPSLEIYIKTWFDLQQAQTE